MKKRVNGIKRNPDMSDNVCSITCNTDRPGYHVTQANYAYTSDRGPVYRSKQAAIKAARDQGFTHYFAQWHAATFRPYVLPRMGK